MYRYVSGVWDPHVESWKWVTSRFVFACHDWVAQTPLKSDNRVSTLP
jgi:hypothetical protein